MGVAGIAVGVAVGVEVGEMVAVAVARPACVEASGEAACVTKLTVAPWVEEQPASKSAAANAARWTRGPRIHRFIMAFKAGYGTGLGGAHRPRAAP